MPERAFDLVFPVVGGNKIKDDPNFGGMKALKGVYGTAFFIGENVFMTAGHVMENVTAHEAYDVGVVQQDQWHAAQIEEFEIFHDYDLALFKANAPSAKCMAWYTTELSMLDPIQTVGYPFALDYQDYTLNVRAFRGEIVSKRIWTGLKSKLRIYELSFPCPRGISGAPLWTVIPTAKVAGIIIGNRITEMIVHSEKEMTNDGVQTIYEKTEALHLGMAIQARSVLQIQSNILAMTIGDFLHKLRLI